MMANGEKMGQKQEGRKHNLKVFVIMILLLIVSQTFKDWQKNVEKDIRKKCHFFTDKSMLSKIIH